MDFMNFVSLAKSSGLRFYIDNLGEYAISSLTTISVLYNEYQTEKMQGIMDRMVEDKVNNSHVIDSPAHPSLHSVIRNYEKTTQISYF